VLDTGGVGKLAMDLADMARNLLAQPTVDDTLERIVAHAVELVDGCEAAGILAVQDGHVETVVATDGVVRVSDRIQGELGEGPCLDAEQDRQPVYRIADMSSVGDRWARYAPKACEVGIGSMMGFLLYTHGHADLGALNLYSSQTNAFTETSEYTGWLLASHAAVALSSARHDADLHEALATRQHIGEATGFVMARYNLTRGDAFDRIVKASQNNNIKVRDLARLIKETGELPESP
jgi:transcriptional regulator with GAF, ATPase, and Fis domain